MSDLSPEGVELRFIKLSENSFEDKPEARVMRRHPQQHKLPYGRMEHRINHRGDGVECHSAEDSRCRHAPLCDTEFWMDNGCQLHDEEHQPQPGQDCWLIQWINNDELEASYIEPSEPVEIKPGALVEIEYEGEYATWEYKEPRNA